MIQIGLVINLARLYENTVIFSAFHQMKACIMKSAQESDQRLCSEKSVENLEKYINTMSGNTLNLMCADYDEDSDKCKQLPNLPKGVKFSKPLTIIEGFGKILA